MNYQNNLFTECNICFEMIPKLDIDNHQRICKEEQIMMINKYNLDNQLTILQTNAIKFAEKKSKIISKNVYLMILAKYKFLGYTEDDLKATIKYIQTNVPIVIHLNLDKAMKFLCDDSEYRNQFETGTSGGALSKESRIQWERTLFNRIYDKSENSEKVKYGALNITCDPVGVVSAYGYGDSYLKLNNEIKSRTTFIHGDSSKQDLHIVTFSSPVPILNFLDNSSTKSRELADVIDIAIGKKEFAPPHRCYIEAQIHGPVRLNKDIDVLMVNKRHKNNPIMIDMLEYFTNKHNCKYKFME